MRVVRVLQHFRFITANVHIFFYFVKKIFGFYKKDVSLQNDIKIISQ